MTATAEKTDPRLWEEVKRRVTEGDKGGRPGQWSARKAQLAVQRYKAAGGGFKGKRDSANHLRQWEREEWGTRSGRPSADTGERYLPRAARTRLSAADYARTSAKKRADSKAGRQFSAQPRDIARKTAPFRDGGAQTAAELADLSRAALLDRARRRRIAGCSRMRKDELVRALAGRQR